LSQLEVDTDIRPYSELLQDANKELSLLNLSYERLLLEYRGAKENAERLTVELRVANARLQELAFRDGLTGLYNHRYFQEAVDKEMARAERSGRPVTLIMVDLDNFKTINDTYGHQRGDIVLQAVSRQIEQISRKTDVVARYGGEEFMVILPETSRTFALRKAEEYRSVVENMEVLADGIMIRITISVGVVTYDPTQDTNNRDKLIRLADSALYKSKQSGRNRVTA
jgi:diguanylate cyclase (GGDEF)-like protein